ncbi:MAG: hypothetical protein HY466_07205 [Deltaproteobacteria bacterium]|nr:hypothetical protein [Deltaproteobacteria bacterium]
MKIAEARTEAFRGLLARLLKEKVELVIHDNTHVFMNAYFRKKRWVIRLHWMFLKSPAMARQIGSYLLTRNKENSKAIDRYIENHWHWVRHPMPPLQHRGRHYDLKKIRNDLNRRYLGGRITAQITWGPKNSRRAYEQMQMGSYSTSRNLIIIHPGLDQKFVPRYVVAATVFHEMCHALVPVKEKGGRKQIHPLSFRKLEARYPSLDKAKKWEEAHFTKLLRRPFTSC